MKKFLRYCKVCERKTKHWGKSWYSIKKECIECYARFLTTVPNKDDEDMYERAKLWIVCPNILSSMYAQEKLRDELGFKILSEENKPHFTDRFVVVPPPLCYAKVGSDKKPVICSAKPTYDQDMNEIYDKTRNWIDLFDALEIIMVRQSLDVFIKKGPPKD